MSPSRNDHPRAGVRIHSAQKVAAGAPDVNGTAVVSVDGLPTAPDGEVEPFGDGLDPAGTCSIDAVEFEDLIVKFGV